MNTVGFLHDIWSRIEEVGGKIIDDENRRAVAIEFPTEVMAEEFSRVAGNDNIWIRPIVRPMTVNGCRIDLG